ncbi:hypothetical protein DRN74_02620 [Candidatus Micrarchaeota archaeon]|nr:MAG: hypothetical protein DRN74_02620 [Candidatus Micrarchaeota archaeon]
MLDEKRIALAAGVSWAVFMLFLWTGVYFFNYGTELMLVFSSIYLGFDASMAGLLLGMIWGFVDIFIGAYIFAYIYNWLGKKK